LVFLSLYFLASSLGKSLSVREGKGNTMSTRERNSFEEIVADVAQRATEKKRTSENITLKIRLNDIAQETLKELSAKEISDLFLSTPVSPRVFFQSKLEWHTQSQQLDRVIGACVTSFLLEEMLPMDDWRQFLSAIMGHIVARRVKEKLLAHEHSYFYF